MSKDPKPPRQRMFTVKQIAEADQVSPRTVWRWIHDGLLPYVKLGALVRIREDDHEAFLAKHRVM
jgi:excisionase family DNA binding protein